MPLGRPVMDDLKWETTSLEIEQLTYPPNTTNFELEFKGRGLIWDLCKGMRADYTVTFFLEDLSNLNADLKFEINGKMDGRDEYQIEQQAVTGVDLVQNTPYKVTAVVVIKPIPGFTLTGFYDGGVFEA